MKIHYVWTLCVLAITSCTMEETQPGASQDHPQGSVAKLAGYPENPANAYDDSGKLYFEICDAYLNGSQNIASIGDAIAKTETLAAANQGFLGIKPVNYSPLSSSRMLYLVSDTPNRFSETLSQSALGWRAQVSLANFVSSLHYYSTSKEEYATMHSFIVAYESSVNADPLFSQNERGIMLTVASLARYGYYFAKKEKEKEPKRRDRDWDMSVPNFSAAVDGANTSTAASVTAATAAALYLNR